MTVETQEKFRPLIVEVADAGLDRGEGPDPETLSEISNSLLDRYETFIANMPENLSSISLRDKDGNGWSVELYSDVDDGSKTEKVTLFGHVNGKRVFIDVKRPEAINPHSGDYPFKIIDYNQHRFEMNTNWLVERTTKLTDQLLGPYEKSLIKEQSNTHYPDA